MKQTDFLNVLITEKKVIANDYCELKLRSAHGGDLPEFSAGAHISVKTPQGGMRHYSLANSPRDRDHYLLAVKAEKGGRGASLSLVDEVSVGDILEILPPENNFELVPAEEYLFIAGGIGITPILAMCRQLQSEGQSNFHLIYCTQSRETTVFADQLSEAGLADHVTLHHDEGEISNNYDFWPHFETPSQAHVYCCGPKSMMETIRDMSGHWPESQIHFEDFNPVEVLQKDDVSFTVFLKKSNTRITVPADQTILETLRNHGYDLRSSCESGTCGSCKTGLLDGEIDHRDLVLSDAEKEIFVMICVSRAKGGEITLDL